MDIKEHNKEMMDRFGYMPLILGEIEGKKIKHISFKPFEDMPIQRKYEIGNAYQIKESEDGLEIYYEPAELYPGNRIIFVENIQEKGIVKGDTGIIDHITSSNKLEITLDKKNDAGFLMSLRGINSTSCVYDTDYKFAHFCKVSTSEKRYFARNGYGGYTEGSHFTDDDRPIIYSIRYKGDFTNEIAEKLREQFEKEKPGLVKLEQEGKFAFLLMDRHPGHNGKKTPTEMDVYRRPKNFSILKSYPIKNKFKI